MLDVVLLWHMHQPYYVDPLTRTALMPWVRLHAAKGYRDMAEMSRRFPEAQLTFNFAPVLVKQLLELQRGEVTDLWEQWSRRPAGELSPAEKRGVVENFFKLNHRTEAEPYPRYAELLRRRGGAEATERQVAAAVATFSEQDFRDLQTWFNLAWCGFDLCERFSELEALKEKGRDFTEEEKNRVLDAHREAVSSVLDLYRVAREEGRAELTTTPFFHPIMPLVYDTELARRCMPGRELPARFTAPEDVERHLGMAQELHTRVFGAPARGLWPSEGSVAPELLPLFAKAGIEYFFTDEEVLFSSLKAVGTTQPERRELFRGYDCGAGVKGMFRDHGLSDFLGFNAARNTASEAARYLVSRLEQIADTAGHEDAAVLIALDGENPWESFADGGEEFLTAFYGALTRSKKIRTRLPGDYFDGAKGLPLLRKLHTGSWINGDFDIWIGDKEENRAWELLGRTRAFLKKVEGDLSVEARERAWQEVYAAEGSDWFWWYGPDFRNDSDFIFDALFRKHLQNVYLLTGVVVPAELDAPIRQRRVAATYTRPTRFIAPGGAGYFDWYGAGYLDPELQQTAMFQSGRISKGVWFGFDRENLYLRYEFNRAPECIVFEFRKPVERRVVLQYRDGKYAAKGARFIVNRDDRVECAIPLAELGVTGDGVTIAFLARLPEKEVDVEQCPEHGVIEFNGPTAEFGLRDWLV